MASPFLEIVTRNYKRDEMLACNIKSIERQTSDDWKHTILYDHEGCGIAQAQKMLAENAGKLTGSYIWILDDDDECIIKSFVAELKEISRLHDPDVIMVRMDHDERGILPDIASWCKPPQHGKIGCSAYVVKRELWQKHAHVWNGGKYHSDFDFIEAVYKDAQNIYWQDSIASRVQRISYGVMA